MWNKIILKRGEWFFHCEPKPKKYLMNLIFYWNKMWKWFFQRSQTFYISKQKKTNKKQHLECQFWYDILNERLGFLCIVLLLNKCKIKKKKQLLFFAIIILPALRLEHPVELILFETKFYVIFKKFFTVGFPLFGLF